jgi:hypothetical protein
MTEEQKPYDHNAWHRTSGWLLTNTELVTQVVLEGGCASNLQRHHRHTACTAITTQELKPAAHVDQGLSTGEVMWVFTSKQRLLRLHMGICTSPSQQMPSCELCAATHNSQCNNSHMHSCTNACMTVQHQTLGRH